MTDDDRGQTHYYGDDCVPAHVPPHLTLALDEVEVELLQDAVANLMADYLVRKDRHRDDPRVAMVNDKFDRLVVVGRKLGLEL